LNHLYVLPIELICPDIPANVQTDFLFWLVSLDSDCANAFTVLPKNYDKDTSPMLRNKKRWNIVYSSYMQD
jgi:hypothetical protein